MRCKPNIDVILGVGIRDYKIMRLRYVTVRPRTLIIGSLLVLAIPHEDVLPKTNFYVVKLPVERGS